MTARARTLGTLALGLVLATGPGPVGWGTPASAESPALVVPDTPTGDTTVTASADPAGWPYLQVRLGRDFAFAPPYEQVDAIDPAPVANDGSAVHITVPTWGMADVDADFVLLGCSSSDPVTCATLLAREDRRLTQSSVATTAVDVPAEPVFVPEEQVRIRVDNAGGGEMFASTTKGRPPGFVRLTNHATTVYDAFPELSGRTQLRVARCSALTSDRRYCEPPVVSQELTFVNQIPVDPVFQSSTTRLTVDPSWHTSRTPVSVYSVSGAHVLSWSLYDQHDALVVGPVTVPTGTSALDQLDFSPGVHASSPLPDGTYTARFTSTVTKGDLTRSGTGEQTVELVNDPPADEPLLVSAQRLLRPSALGGTLEPRFEVQAYPGGYHDATMRLRDADGDVVEQLRVGSPCWSYWPAACPPEAVWEVDFGNVDTQSLRAGVYRAELEMPDSYGRMMVRRLGRVAVQETVEIARTVTRTARRALLPRAGTVGRCSAVVRPGTLDARVGSVGLVSGSRCASVDGPADLVRQVFELPIPRWVRHRDVAHVTVDSSVRASSVRRGNHFARAASQFAPGERWHRAPAFEPRGWQEAGSLFRASAGYDPQGDRVRVGVTVDHGVVADVDRLRVRVVLGVWRTPRS